MACPSYFIVYSQRTLDAPTYMQLPTSVGLVQARPNEQQINTSSWELPRESTQHNAVELFYINY